MRLIGKPRKERAECAKNRDVTLSKYRIARSRLTQPIRQTNANAVCLVSKYAEGFGVRVVNSLE